MKPDKIVTDLKALADRLIPMPAGWQPGHVVISPRAAHPWSKDRSPHWQDKLGHKEYGL